MPASPSVATCCGAHSMATLRLKPQGGVNAVAWVGGVQYAVGPVTIAATYMNYQSQGNATMINKSQSYNDGFSRRCQLHRGTRPECLCGIYLRPNSSGRHEPDHRHANTSANNDSHGQSFIIGTRVQW